MATLRDLITASLKKLGVVAIGEPPENEELQDGLKAMRLMVDAWALENLMIPAVMTVTKTLIIGEGLYTIGLYGAGTPPDNHIETEQPIDYLAAFIRDAQNTDYVIDRMNTTQYSDLSVKNTSARPGYFYVEDGWPLSRIYLNSLPYTADTLYLKVKQNLKALLPLLTLDDVISLPDGYEYALMYNTAYQLATDYGMQPPAVVAFEALESKKKIKVRNDKSLVSRVDRALSKQTRPSGTYNIYSGP